MKGNQVYVNGKWVDEESLNGYVTDKAVIRQLEAKVNSLTKERSHLSAKIEKLSSLVKLQDKTIREFKQWQEAFVGMEIGEKFDEMLKLMEGKDMERKMLLQLSRFFKENLKYTALTRKLQTTYGKMIQHEVNAMLCREAIENSTNN